MLTRIMYPLRIKLLLYILLHVFAVLSNYGPYYRSLEIPQFLNGTVYTYHGYFRLGSEFEPVFVTFYGSLMVHGYGSVKSQVLHVTV